MELNFINIHDAPVVIPAIEPVKKTRKPSPESYHKGWLVLGFSPQHLEDAERKHLSQASDKTEAKTESKPFDLAEFLRKAKPRKVRSKPYGVHASALECAELARKAGWQLVQVVAKAKGKAP